MTLDQVTRVLNDLECSSTSANSEAFTFGKSFFLFLYPEVCCIHFMSILSDVLLCLIIWRLECSITVFKEFLIMNMSLVYFDSYIQPKTSSQQCCVIMCANELEPTL
jgi:hypothetical protein